ncbi:Tigger transposable element-derived protein 4 [Araneus ventricosus]|uniref:Tigger transposable element-derived protein 4 n=1 Tax=Araneus ventricosus TaxID=182803 RepID=A0A4Y2HYY2_ARAVE|nr:Tigger transposable element-derived protein 4 [Araneus ventricosus]
MTSRNRKSLSLEEKTYILKKVDENQHLKRVDLAKELGLPVSTFNTLIYKHETGLFYNLLSSKTLAIKSDSCHGGKKNKERLTALLCANADGSEKLPPLIIGKSKKPRCFKNVKTLPTKYLSNKKSWMTMPFFTDWLKGLDDKMLNQKRRMILFIDQCPAHPPVDVNPIENAESDNFVPPENFSNLSDVTVFKEFVQCDTELETRSLLTIDEMIANEETSSEEEDNCTEKPLPSFQQALEGFDTMQEYLPS